MTFLNAFLLVGTISLIGQLILDNTKLTPGHITSIFVVLGSLMGFFGLYEPLRNWANAGASIPIISFGDLLFKSGLVGFKEGGILGIFTNLLSLTSAGITASIVFAFFLTIFSKPKD